MEAEGSSCYFKLLVADASCAANRRSAATVGRRGSYKCRMTTRHITVLGTGRMGSALALAFKAHGHTVTVWNRTTAKARPLEAQGVTVTGSVAEAVSEAELV